MDIVYYNRDVEEYNGPLRIPSQKDLFEYINKSLKSGGKNFYFWTKSKTGPYAPNYDNYTYMKGGSIVTPFDLILNKVEIDSVVTAEELEVIEKLGIDSKHYYMVNIDGVYGGPYHYDCGRFYDAQNRGKNINLDSAKIITIEDFIEKMKGVYIPADKKEKDDEPAAKETVVDIPVVGKTDTLAVVNSIINNTEDEEEADNADDIDDADNVVNADSDEEIVETADESQGDHDIYNEYLNGNSYSDIAKKYNKNMSEVFKIILEEKKLVTLGENK